MHYALHCCHIYISIISLISSGAAAYVRVTDVGWIRLESFHPESATVFLQPDPLVRVLFWDLLLLLLAGGNLSIVKAMNECKGIPDGQQTDLVAEVVPESPLECNL